MTDEARQDDADPPEDVAEGGGSQDEAPLRPADTGPGDDTPVEDGLTGNPDIDQLRTELKSRSAATTQQVIDAVCQGCRHLSADLDALKSGLETASRAELERIDEVAQVFAGRTEEVLTAVRTGAPREGGTESDKLHRLISTFNADLERWRKVNRRRDRWLTIAGVLVALPCVLLLGLLVQYRFEPIPAGDPTQGWRDYVWQAHGQAIRKCEERARSERRAVDCKVIAAAPETASSGR